MAFSRTFRVTPVLLTALLAAACQSQSGPAAGTGGSSAASVAGDRTPQPRKATYTCTDGSRMVIENLGSSIRLLDSDGAVDEELPASPANQRSRFGAEHDAIVIDGREALVMKGGHTPIACRR